MPVPQSHTISPDNHPGHSLIAITCATQSGNPSHVPKLARQPPWVDRNSDPQSARVPNRRQTGDLSRSTEIADRVVVVRSTSERVEREEDISIDPSIVSRRENDRKREPFPRSGGGGGGGQGFDRPQNSPKSPRGGVRFQSQPSQFNIESDKKVKSIK